MKRALRWVGTVFGAAVALACAQKAEECKSWSADVTGAGWSQCGDGKGREVACAKPAAPGQPQTCTCNVGGVVGKSFSVTDPSVLGTLESATATANENCGWHITR